MAKILWIVELGKFLLESMKRGILGNILAMLIISAMISYAGYTWGMTKHNEAMGEIHKNAEAIESFSEPQRQTLTTLQVMQNTLQNMSENLRDVKEDIKTTKARVWQIREDQLKGN